MLDNSFPASVFFFFFSKLRLACANSFHSIGQDQSTVAQRAETTVTKRSLMSCVRSCVLIDSHSYVFWNQSTTQQPNLVHSNQLMMLFVWKWLFTRSVQKDIWCLFCVDSWSMTWSGVCRAAGQTAMPRQKGRRPRNPLLSPVSHMSAVWIVSFDWNVDELQKGKANGL